MSDQDLDDVQPAPSGGSFVTKLVLPVLLINLAATVFFGTRLLAVAGGSSGEAAEEVDSDEPGPIHTMDSFVVNLNDPKKPRFLKVTLNLEVVDDAAIEALTASTHRVRDEVMRYLSSLRLAETLGEQSKLTIQEEIVRRINERVGDEPVRNVFFSEFVVQ